jgi:hypothetical protein
MHRRPDRFNRRSWGRSLNCRRSADYITLQTADGLKDCSGVKRVFPDLESAEIDEDSDPVGTGLSPSSHRHANVEPAPALQLL